MNYTINEIPDEAVELSGTEMIPIWQGETKKVSVATLAGYVQDASSYSTTETLTGGVWIDGKPIYRRAFTGLTSISTSWTTIPDSTNNYRCIVSIDFAFSGIRGGFLQSRINNGHIEVSTTSDMSNIEGIYVEYTKTTD